MDLGKESSTLKKWRLYTYDLWGNEEDGYTVNDYYPGPIIELAENPSDQEALEAVEATDDVEIDHGLFNDHIIYFVNKHNGKPEGELRLIEKE